MKNLYLTSDHQLRRIIFWEPCISPHKADFLNAVSIALPSIEIICCADQGLPDNRKALGWSILKNDRITTIISPNAEEINNLVLELSANTFHIFSGTRHLSTLTLGLKTIKLHKARFSIMSEPRVSEGWKGTLRFVQSWLTEGWLRRNCEFILAIGRNGPSWFNSVGYDSTKIFPFAYFVAPPKPIEKNRDCLSPSIINIGYVGRIVASKGVFDLVKATKFLENPIQLTFVGAGVDQDKLKQMCLDYSVSTDFYGVLPIKEIGAVMEKIDVLILASTSEDDGWGVVVSEALMSGTAVIATNCVGASIMLDEELFGYMVPPHNPHEIAKSINKQIVSGAFTYQNRLVRQALAKSMLSSEAGARYFTEILYFQLGERVLRPKPFFLNK